MGSRSMTGGCPEPEECQGDVKKLKSENGTESSESQEIENVKKIKTLMPVRSDEIIKEDVDSEPKPRVDNSDSESEEETRVINDIDYEALEDIWLKAGEIEAKDMICNSEKKKRKSKGCGKCKGCKRDEDCGSCRNCQEERVGNACLAKRCRGKRRSRAKEEWSTDAGGQSTEGDTSDEDWKMTEEDDGQEKKVHPSPERKRKSNPVKTPKKSFKNEAVKDEFEAEISGDEPPPAVVTRPWQPTEYKFMDHIYKNNQTGPPVAPPKPGPPSSGGFASSFLDFLSGKSGPPAPTPAPKKLQTPAAPLQPSTAAPAPMNPAAAPAHPSAPTNPMIRVDYEKSSEEAPLVPKVNDLNKNSNSNTSQSLSSTIEKLKSNLGSNNNSNGNSNGINSSSQSDIIEVIEDKKELTQLEKVLELLLGYGMTTQQVTSLQRGNPNIAVEKLLNKAAQMSKLQSQMSKDHRKSLSFSNPQQVHRASALAVLDLLPAANLTYLETSLSQLTRWFGELKMVGIRWELAVRPPPGEGHKKSFIIEKRQLKELDLDTVNTKSFMSSK